MNNLPGVTVEIAHGSPTSFNSIIFAVRACGIPGGH